MIDIDDFLYEQYKDDKMDEEMKIKDKCEVCGIDLEEEFWLDDCKVCEECYDDGIDKGNENENF